MSTLGLVTAYLGSVLLLAYIYAGYPALVWALGRRRADRSPCPAGSETVSIVIVAHNEMHSLPAKLASLFQSQGADRIVEVLIGSDGSTDRTCDVLRDRQDSRVQVFEFPQRRGKPSVLNDLVPRCQGDLVLLADARQIFDPECLERLVAVFRDPQVGVVSGELILRSHVGASAAAEGIGFYWRYEKFLRKSESRWRGVPGATGACYALRKSLFRPIPPETILDDVAIPMAVVEQGYQCRFEPDAKVYDEPSKSTRQESIRKRRTIAGNVQLCRLFPQLLLPWRNPLWFEFLSHKLLRLVSPLLMAVVLGSNLALLELTVFRVLLVLQAGFYAAALIGWAYQVSGRGSRLFGPPLMFVTLNLTTLAALWDAAFARFRVTWQKTA